MPPSISPGFRDVVSGVVPLIQVTFQFFAMISVINIVLKRKENLSSKTDISYKMLKDLFLDHPVH